MRGPACVLREPPIFSSLVCVEADPFIANQSVGGVTDRPQRRPREKRCSAPTLVATRDGVCDDGSDLVRRGPPARERLSTSVQPHLLSFAARGARTVPIATIRTEAAVRRGNRSSTARNARGVDGDAAGLYHAVHGPGSEWGVSHSMEAGRAIEPEHLLYWEKLSTPVHAEASPSTSGRTLASTVYFGGA